MDEKELKRQIAEALVKAPAPAPVQTVPMPFTPPPSASLEDVQAAAAPLIQDPFAERPDNFLGDFTVGVTGKKKK